MSVETWKAEYYPTPADSPELDTDEKRILHSLKKFEGARPEALKKHDVQLSASELFDSCDTFYFDMDSCSLCFEYYSEEAIDECAACPLSMQGDECCSSDEDPFSIFTYTDNPEPMITALKKALAKARGK